MHLRTTLAPFALGLALAACGNDSAPTEETAGGPLLSETPDPTVAEPGNLGTDPALDPVTPAADPGFAEPDLTDVDTAFTGEWVSAEDPASTLTFAEEEGDIVLVSSQDGAETDRVTLNFVSDCVARTPETARTDYFLAGVGEGAPCYYIVSANDSQLVLSDTETGELATYGREPVPPLPDIDDSEMDGAPDTGAQDGSGDMPEDVPTDDEEPADNGEG